MPKTKRDFKKTMDPATVCYLSFRERLQKELDQRQTRQARYSLRSFARFLKIDVSTLQKIMAGKRALGEKTIASLAKRLGMDPAEIASYVEAHRQRRQLGTSLANDRQRVTYQVLGQAHVDLISRWESYAILELARLPGFLIEPRAVAAALGITVKRASKFIRDLEEIAWLVRDSAGRWTPAMDSTTTDPLDPSLTKARRVLMESIVQKSLAAYRSGPSPRQLHYARSLAFDRRLMGAVMAKIRAFADDLQSFIKDQGAINDVYQLQLGFYL